MLRAAPLALVLLAARPMPAPAALHAIALRAKPSLGALLCGRSLASAVVVGGSGQVLTASGACPKGEVRLRLADGRTLPLSRVRADATLGLQLLQLPPGTYAAAPAAPHAAFAGDWIVAVAASAHGVRAAAGMLHEAESKTDSRVLIDAPTHLGAGVFSLKGKLVGIAVGPAPRHQMHVAPIDAIRDWLAGAQRVASAPGGAK